MAEKELKATPEVDVEKVLAENEKLKAELASKESVGGAEESGVVPPKWKELVVKYLGEDFECEVVSPDNGGTKFTIIVPREKSNASSIYWEMHTVDRRTKEIGNTGLTGVEEWCKRVRANLVASGKQVVTLN